MDGRPSHDSRSCEQRMQRRLHSLSAWALAAAGTQHLFTRRQPTGPAIPVETWAVIEFIQTFLGDDTIRFSQFSVEEATQDTYRFAGSLSAGLLCSHIAHISVQIVKSILPSGGDEAWAVRRIVLTDSVADLSIHYLRSRSWSSLPSNFLLALPLLQQLLIICGKSCSEAEFYALCDKVTRAVKNHPAVALQHNPDMPDGRFLQPALFGLGEEDLEWALRTRNEKEPKAESSKWSKESVQGVRSGARNQYKGSH
ncbi:uncharacterized protein PHACADRAFT_265744 [Phanerochaete carnosa HHB-10118-sp]|uniref:Uncharacterized protein n=2 Tax=Phanerochaete carnosa (strain HHB-10118-sp) TaxID=650164 RepID=K5VDK3_PHACS|nr:uncharacterized protein PHACADRAFT_265744 [Phanerochaete carnosa HHB-10118-sp]EKM49208.1 hypothetical protein PHACADRAFT_265744 [Phanerochaete carnosa HHB-10118-sp]